MTRLYSALRGLLTTYDYTQEQFGRELGLKRTSVIRRMGGSKPFTLDEAYRALDLFRVPHSRLHEIFPPDGKKEA